MVRQLIQEIRCPLCQSVVEQTDATTFDPIVEHGGVVQGRKQATKARQTTVAACTGCEFLVDLRRVDGVLKSPVELIQEVGQWVRKH